MKLQLEMMSNDTSRQNLQSDVEDMQNMVEGYLSFAKGQEAEAVQLVNLSILVKEVADNAERQGGTIKMTGEPDIASSIRPNSVKRCLTNLVENARRYASEIHLDIRKAEENIIVTVDDNGPGIPRDKRIDVFKPFYRLDTSRNSETGGSGLGMTIARDVMHGHGGQIRLSDSPKKGLRIELLFPL